MSWNYRIIRHTQSFTLNGEEIDTSYLALHEVYYDENGKPEMHSRKEISFQCDVDEGKEVIITKLKRAIGTIENEDVLDEAVFDE